MSLLAKILTKKSLTLIGLNTGTSADGLDMAVVRVSRARGTPEVRYVKGTMKAFPPGLRELILRVSDPKTSDLDTAAYLDQALGSFSGRTAAAFIERLRRDNISIDALASHGQTVRHLPRKVKMAGQSVNSTVQLGSPDQIAAHTGKVVIGDFRQADIAVGNEGAPITTGAMLRMFSTAREPRLLVNIGGIANYFYFPASRTQITGRAADCGPGNSLSDILSRRLYGENLDRQGQRASQGHVSQRLMETLLAHPFFSGSCVSTGREAFGESLAREVIAFGLRHNLYRDDLMATVTEFTACAVAAAIRPVVQRDRRLTKLYLTGGGRKNRFLVKRLQALISELEILPIDRLGMDGDMIEAAAFAVMGEACLRSEPLNPPATGDKAAGRARPVLGRIAQPPIHRKR